MPADSSFDIVSRVDLQEVDNAVNQAKKEIMGRFDFKGSNCSITLDRKEKKLEFNSDDKMRHHAVIDIMKQRLSKRGISLKSLKFGDEDIGIDGRVKQSASLQMGIPVETAKQITAQIRQSKLKVTAQIQDEQIRVTAKSKDDLQAVIQMVRQNEYEVPLQFANYR